MHIEFIYTFDNLPQDIRRYVFDMYHISDKDNFLKFAMQDLSYFEKQQLVKISCCIYTLKKEINFPDWFEDSNGKFYFDHSIET